VISLTKINGTPFVVNAELIQTIENTPDTMLTMLSGEKLVVKESTQEVVDRALAYKQRIFLGQMSFYKKEN